MILEGWVLAGFVALMVAWIFSEEVKDGLCVLVFRAWAWHLEIGSWIHNQLKKQ